MIPGYHNLLNTSFEFAIVALEAQNVFAASGVLQEL
jgi:hypothetical protein